MRYPKFPNPKLNAINLLLPKRLLFLIRLPRDKEFSFRKDSIMLIGISNQFFYNLMDIYQRAGIVQMVDRNRPFKYRLTLKGREVQDKMISLFSSFLKLRPKEYISYAPKETGSSDDGSH